MLEPQKFQNYEISREQRETRYHCFSKTRTTICKHKFPLNKLPYKTLFTPYIINAQFNDKLHKNIFLNEKFAIQIKINVLTNLKSLIVKNYFHTRKSTSHSQFHKCPIFLSKRDKNYYKFLRQFSKIKLGKILANSLNNISTICY